MIVLGRIVAPYGVRGWLRLHPFGDDPEAWGEMEHWWLGRDDKDFADWQVCVPEAMKPQGKGWVVKFAGVDDRSGAERLVRFFVGAPREELPATDRDEFYWADLIGLVVVNEAQQPLGRVTELIESGAHAVMVVEEGEGRNVRKRLLPFVDKVVRAVDVPGGMIRVDWQTDW